MWEAEPPPAPVFERPGPCNGSASASASPRDLVLVAVVGAWLKPRTDNSTKKDNATDKDDDSDKDDDDSDKDDD